MRILRLRTYCHPEVVSAMAIGEDLDNAFEKNGIVSINITPMPSRGVSDEVRKAYKNKKYEELHNGYVIIHRFPMIKEGTNVLQKSVKYLLCTIVEYFKGINMKDIDAVFVGSTPPTQGLLAAKVAQKLSKRYGRKVPFVYNLQDIFPDSLVGTGLTKKGSLLWKIGRKMEDYTYRHADKIIVISEGFKRNIMAKGVSEEKIKVIYNWADIDNIYPVERKDNILFERYHLDPSKFYVVYSGNIGLTQNMDLLLDAAKEIGKELEQIHFVLIGEGAAKTHVESRINEEAIDNVTVLPFQPYKDIRHVFSLGDVGLIISKPQVGANSVPSKTWNIMASGRPVLASFDEGELKEVVEENGCGVFAKAGDLCGFVKAIVSLSKNPDLCRQYGENGRQFVLAHLTKDVGTGSYIEVMKNCVQLPTQCDILQFQSRESK